MKALNETLTEGGSVTDGTAITQRMWGRTFSGNCCDSILILCDI